MSDKLLKIALALAGIGISLWIIASVLGKLLAWMPLWAWIVLGTLAGASVLLVFSKAFVNLQARRIETKALRLEAEADYKRVDLEAEARRAELVLREKELEQRAIDSHRAYSLKYAELRIKASQIGFETQVLLRENGEVITLPATDIRMQEAIAGPRSSGQAQITGPASVKASNIITSDFPAERVLFSDVFKTFTPTKERIFLLDTTNGPVTGPLKGVTHVALVGPTGGGKTITTRMLTAQFQFVGAKMYLASPNFAQLKLNGSYLEDWRPIVQHLAEPPAQTANEIDSLLKRFKTLFEQRKAREQSTPRRGADIFLVLGEWPGIVARCPDAAEIIVLLLREARQYGIHLIFEFQDALVATLGVNSGARENIRHAYYYGGDIRTAKFALSLATGMKLDETGLGKNGAVYMRSLISDQIISGRVPLFNNQALYMLLGTPPDPVPDYEITDESQIPETYYHVEHGQYVEGSATIARTEQETEPLETASSVGHLRVIRGTQTNAPVEQIDGASWDAHETQQDRDLRVFQEGRTVPAGVPQDAVNALVAPVGHGPVDVPFVPQGDDKLVPEEDHDVLAHWYTKLGNVRIALNKIGITNNRYNRHASWILEQRGLKAARRA